MGSKRVLLFVPKTIEDNQLPWLRQGSFLKKYNMVQRVALATTWFLSLEEYNMLQKITMATTGFLSFTTPYLESSKGCGTRGHLTLGLVAIYSKVKGKLVLCVLGKFDRVPEPLEPGLNPPLVRGYIHNSLSFFFQYLQNLVRAERSAVGVTRDLALFDRERILKLLVLRFFFQMLKAAVFVHLMILAI